MAWRDRALLEVVADRPVAEHLEEGVVGVVADLGDVVAQPLAAEALLARHQQRRRRGHLAGDERLEWNDPGHGEEQGRIVVGDQRGARQTMVSVVFEVAEKTFPDLVGAQTPVQCGARGREPMTAGKSAQL